MAQSNIEIVGAREHNLKGINVRIPRGRLTVITGLSGSGKSSLAFDTLYAEGQRRYVESLSAYARQFLGRMQKPDVEHIEGLSPAVAIEQRGAASNPRSIVATTTEIHDYLRLLYANIAHRHCPKCGARVKRQSAQEVVEVLLALDDRTRLVLLAPWVRDRAGTHKREIEAIRQQGFVRVRADGKLYELDDLPRLSAKESHTIDAVVDRIVITEGVRSRLADSVELALKQGHGTIKVLLLDSEGEAADEKLFSEKNVCVPCGVSFDEPVPRNFSFNSPYGACPLCDGIGKQLVFDENMIIPDRTLSIEAGAIAPWRKGGRRLIAYYRRLLRNVVRHYGVEAETPYEELPDTVKQVLMNGSGEEEIEHGSFRGGSYRRGKKPFEGVLPNLKRRLETTSSDYVKVQLRGFMTRRQCPDCGGLRLRPESRSCRVDGVSIVEVTAMSIENATLFFEKIKLPRQEQHIAGELLNEIKRRLSFMLNVGLGYITLDRESSTLSGGEMQRIRLATQIGSGLSGVLYVLDEPTIGLHPRDNTRLIRTLRELQQRGNTVVVVEHDERLIREADYVIDLGPGAGQHGGEVVFAGSVKQLLQSDKSLTARYMNGKEVIEVPSQRRAPDEKRITVRGASENNLRNIDVEIPLGLFVSVTGVSGSGKSTLIDDVLRRELSRRLHGAKALPGKHVSIDGVEFIDKVIVIDQSPIGRTPRSNAVTYTGAFSVIRDLFSKTPASRVRGYRPGRFSFNVKGGRCEACKGDGLIRLDMHFLPDVYVECEVCRGLRYNSETLEIRYGGKTIAEVLDMTVGEAVPFFSAVPSLAAKLGTLQEVGLGYIRLGQSATTLSGGEAQRIKLASELSRRATGSTLYLLDEPTTGLHFADVRRLLDVLLRLRDQGNSVVVIEHNLDVIKMSDYIIDLGPDGGDHGGEVVATGSPEEVAASPASYTGRYLKELLA